MKLFLEILMLGTFLMVPSAPRKLDCMGMSYFLIPDKRGTCSDDFPDRLSFFFEQVGGFGDKAEVAQVSKVLQVDLSIFQDVEYNYENETEVNKHWHELREFTAVVDSLIARIMATPQYYKKVIHDPEYQKHLEENITIAQSGDTAKYESWLREAVKSNFLYPPDYGYLREGRILKDLQDLKNTLDCYEKNGVTRVRLEYM